MTYLITNYNEKVYIDKMLKEFQKGHNINVVALLDCCRNTQNLGGESKGKNYDDSSIPG